MKDWALKNSNGEDMFGRPLDIEYDQNGEILFVEEQKMLEQNLKKISMTQIGSSLLNPQYGTAVASMTGLKLDPSTIGALIVGEMERIVTVMQTMMYRQANAIASERIAGVEDVFVQTVEDDPRKLSVLTVIRTENENSLQLQSSVQTM